MIYPLFNKFLKMRKAILIITLFLKTGIFFGQITTTTIPEKIATKKPAVYDSLTNFLGNYVYKYIGQELYLNKLSESLRKYNYGGFYLDYLRSTSSLKNTYKAVMPENKQYLQYDIGGGHSNYDSIAGKYFKVLEIYKHPKASESEYLYGTKYFLKLEEKESKDIIYYEYDAQFEHSFPFIVVGLFEKIKKRFVGQQFVLSNNMIEGYANYIAGEKWKCIDLSIEDKYYNLSLICQNQSGHKIPIDYKEVLDKNSNLVFTENRADKYKARFGIKNWLLILKANVALGMTKEMCRLAWGEPDKINETITRRVNSDQWVYSHGYLYFDNGILTAIQ